MADSTTQPAGIQATSPVKPAPALVNSAHNPHPGQNQQFQPAQLNTGGDAFRPSRSFSLGKLTLACFNFVFAIIVLGLSVGNITVALFDGIMLILAASLVSTPHPSLTNVSYKEDRKKKDLLIGFPFQGAASILWQLAEFITLAVRRSIHRPIHPGAHVAIHLCLWILAILVAGSACTSVVYISDSYTVDSDCLRTYSKYSSAYGYCDFYSFKTDAAAHKYLRMIEALTAFAILMTVSHFTLFVLACVETERRRKHGRRSRVVYLVATPGPVDDGKTYYTQVPPPLMAQRAAGDVAGSDPGPQGYYTPQATQPRTTNNGAGSYA